MMLSADSSDSDDADDAGPNWLFTAAPRASTGDSLQDLVRCQNFDGSFVLDAALAAAVGKDLADLAAAADGLAAGLGQASTQSEVRAWFAAMVALAYLRTALAARRGEWMLVERKTVQWLGKGMAKLPTGQQPSFETAATLVLAH